MSWDDLTNRAFPYYTAQRITVDLVPVLALRLSYIGELGWELYAPAEQALRLWDTLWEAGGDLGVFALGGGAELAMCCDVLIAAESAKIGDAHANFGVFPGAGGAAVLPSRIGLPNAKPRTAIGRSSWKPMPPSRPST